MPNAPFALCVASLIVPAAYAGDPPSRPPVERPAAPAATIAPMEAPSPVLGDALPKERPLYFDRASDGALWVRGATYKARFDAAGATYIPNLGPDAPRNFPVRFTLDAVSIDGAQAPLADVGAAVRDGERVTIAHGACGETWIVARESVEQTFVFHERFTGALQLAVAVDTELAGRAVESGFEFAGEHGGVRYGSAWLEDAGGRKALLSTRLEDGRIEIDVPAGLIATACFPIAVDPIVSTFGVDNTGFDDFDADVAYDADSQRYVAVYEETYSATDHDMFAVAMNASGGWITDGYIDFSAADWRGAHIANLNGSDQFLVVASVLDGGDVHRHVRGRLIAAPTHVFGSVIDIASHPNIDLDEMDVGGDGYPGSPSFFCVVWKSMSPLGSYWIAQYQLVRPDGTLVYAVPQSLDWTVALQYGYEVRSVSVSKSNGENRWTVAVELEIQLSGFVGYWSDFSTGSAQIGWDGSVATLPWLVDGNQGIDDFNPSASTQLDDGSVMIVFERDVGGGNRNLYAHVINGNTSLAQANLTTLDPTVDASRYQGGPSVESDGHQFTLVYEQDGSPIPHVYLSSYYFSGSQIGLSQSSISLSIGVFANGNPDIVGIRGTSGIPRRFFAIWDAFQFTPPSGGHDDIYGALYDGNLGGPVSSFCSGYLSLPPCPCTGPTVSGNGCPNSANSAGANLARLSGEASVFADSLVFRASGMTGGACVFIQGSASTAPVQVSDGLVCLGGSIVRMATKAVAGGQSTYPEPGDAAISVRGAVPPSGATRHYQTYYRNSVASYCPVGGTGNYTNALRVVWVP